MATIDITPKILEYLLADTCITDVLGDRISSPEWYIVEGEEEINPKMSFRQMGGAVGFHRYLFLVEGDTAQQARECAIIVRNKLIESPVSFPGVNIEYIYGDGSLVDLRNENNNKRQVMFYLNFELMEF